MMFVIAFIGADGTGKTTLVNSLMQQLDASTKRLYLGQKHFILPLIGRWATTNGRIRSAIFRWITYPIDLRLRTTSLTVRHLIRKKHQVMLIDRLPAFPFDGRSRILQAVYNLVLPRVDMLVLLSGDPDLIYSRKPGGSKQDLLRQLEKVEILFENFGTQARVRLDISRTVDQHVAEITGQITAKIERDVGP